MGGAVACFGGGQLSELCQFLHHRQPERIHRRPSCHLQRIPCVRSSIAESWNQPHQRWPCRIIQCSRLYIFSSSDKFHKICTDFFIFFHPNLILTELFHRRIMIWVRSVRVTRSYRVDSGHKYLVSRDTSLERYRRVWSGCVGSW